MRCEQHKETEQEWPSYLAARFLSSSKFHHSSIHCSLACY